MRNGHRIIIMLAAGMVTAFFSCAGDTDTVEDTGRDAVKFFSAAKPGPWESQAADHEPEITITKVDDGKILNVNVPFAMKKEKDHYVEVILVLNLERKELRKMSIEKGRGSKGAKFEFPANFNTPVYVVVKCNKHDMWEKQVDWSE